MKTGKILILNASPRKRGNIAQMVAEMTDEAKAQGAEVEVIDVQKHSGFKIVATIEKVGTRRDTTLSKKEVMKCRKAVSKVLRCPVL